MDYTKIIQKIKDFISSLQTQTDTPLLRIIVGLSGGPDSVFLLHLLSDLRSSLSLELSAAHLDHGWRAHSADDATFCEEMCNKLKIPFIKEKAETYASQVVFNGSQECFGRDIRRHFFQACLATFKADYIALAHHQQDQHETFFLRLIRGATLDGLTCMKERDDHYLRPLLWLDKKTILDYLKHNTIPYLHDPTNDSLDYLRNAIRHTVIPALLSVDRRFEQKLNDTISHLSAENQFLSRLTDHTFWQVFKTHSSYRLIGSLPHFKKLDRVLQKRLIIQWLTFHKVPFSPSNAYLQEILRFINSPRGGSHSIGHEVKLHKKGFSLWLSTKPHDTIQT